MIGDDRLEDDDYVRIELAEEAERIELEGEELTVPDPATEPSVYTPIDLTEVRTQKFGNAQLDEAVAYAMGSIFPGHRSAFVAVADGTSVRAALYIRPFEHWSFSTFVGKPWGGPLEYGAKVIASW